MGKGLKIAFLHHNLAAYLFLGDLIKAFMREGWNNINAVDAFSDEVFEMVPDIILADESIIWGLAKEKGEYDDILRFPGEDSRYEKKIG